MDRELTRAELDELLPLFALDALDGEEREQVARYVERDDGGTRRGARRCAKRSRSCRRPMCARRRRCGRRIEGSLDAPRADSLRRRCALVPTPARSDVGRRAVVTDGASRCRRGCVAIAVLGVQVARQQDRIDDLAAEMHRDPMQQQALAARASKDAHVIALEAMSGRGKREIVMLPDGTGYFMDHELPDVDG